MVYSSSFSPELASPSFTISSEDSSCAWSHMTEIAKKLFSPPETLAPNFTTFSAKSILTYTICKDNFEYIIQHQLLHSQFYAALIEHAENLEVTKTDEHLERLEVEQTTHIMVPNDDALRCLVYQDVCKYSIPLVVSSLKDLRKTIHHFKEGLSNEHLYCGIMVIEDEPLFSNNWFHAVALLCYFGPKIEGEENRNEEFVLVGSQGDHPKYYIKCELLCAVHRQLTFMNMKGLKIHRKEKYLHLRRTNTRVFLRNALLDLKNRKEGKGFFDLLSEHKNPLNNDLLSLPQSWIYHEELFLTPNMTPQVARDLFSKIPRKRDNPRTINDWRLRKQMGFQSTCTWHLSAGFVEKICSLKPEIVVPRGTRTKFGYKIEYNNYSTSYGFLIDKSWKDSDIVDLVKGNPSYRRGCSRVYRPALVRWAED